MIKTTCIFSYSKANELIIKGFNLLSIEPSIQNKSKLVFMFESNDKLRIYMNLKY